MLKRGNPYKKTNNTIVMVGDYPTYDFIIVDVNGERVSYKVNNYRDYIGKHQICDLSNLTKL